MAGEISQFMTVMTADRFEGPYACADRIYKPLKMDSGDFALHIDSEAKKAYIWFKRPHFQLICATLTEDYTADTSPKEAAPLPGVLQKHNENTCKSRFVWLPIEWEDDKPVIRWRDEWKG